MLHGAVTWILIIPLLLLIVPSRRWPVVECSIILKSSDSNYLIDSHVRITGNLKVDGALPGSIQEKLQLEQRRIKHAQLEQNIWESYEWVNRTSPLLTVDARSNHLMFEFQGRYFITGGISGSFSNGMYDTYEYDPRTRTVIGISTISNALISPHTCAFEDYVLAYGGYDDSSSVTAHTYLFNITTLEWDQKDDGANSVVFGMHGCDYRTNTMYIAGGNTGQEIAATMLVLQVNDGLVTIESKQPINPARIRGVGGFIDGQFVYGMGKDYLSSLSNQFFVFVEDLNMHREIERVCAIPDLENTVYLQIGRIIYAYATYSDEDSNTKPSLFRLEFDSYLTAVQSFPIVTTNSDVISSAYFGAGLLAYPIRNSDFSELAVYGGTRSGTTANAFSTIVLPTSGGILPDSMCVVSSEGDGSPPPADQDP